MVGVVVQVALLCLVGVLQLTCGGGGGSAGGSSLSCVCIAVGALHWSWLLCGHCCWECLVLASVLPE